MTPSPNDAQTGAAGHATRASSADAFGAPCWVSLMARDLDSALDFYGSVMGWTFRPGSLGEEFRIALADGVPVAGIGALAPALQVAVAWTPYFAVADADETAARIRERGATVAVGPVALHTGRGALAADRDGAVFGIWQGSLITNWESWLTPPPPGPGCTPATPSKPRSSTARSWTGPASGRAAATSSTSTRKWSCATVATSSRA